VNQVKFWSFNKLLIELIAKIVVNAFYQILLILTEENSAKNYSILKGFSKGKVESIKTMCQIRLSIN